LAKFGSNLYARSLFEVWNGRPDVDKFTPLDLETAIEELAMLQYFPADDGARAAIMRLLARMVPHREALIWVVRTMVDRVGAWKGPMELRGVLCTRFRPADGVEAFSTIAGFRAEDSEAAYLEEHTQRKVGWITEPDKPAQISGDKSARLLIEGLCKSKEIQ
jgi:hypothetical protein